MKHNFLDDALSLVTGGFTSCTCVLLVMKFFKKAKGSWLNIMQYNIYFNTSKYFTNLCRHISLPAVLKTPIEFSFILWLKKDFPLIYGLTEYTT